MILRLVREQLRSQWRPSAWTTGLLAFAIALATYAMVTGATVLAQQDDTRDTFLYGRGHLATLYSFTNGHPPDVDLAGYGPELPLASVDALIAAAEADGGVTAGRELYARVPGGDSFSIVALATTPRWDTYLVEGSAPGGGEIVLSAARARDLGLGVGDSVTLVTNPGEAGESASMTFAISGILRTGATPPYWTNIPDAYISWADSVAATSALFPQTFAPDVAGATTTMITTSIAWDGDNNAMFPYDHPDATYDVPRGFAFGRAYGSGDPASTWALLISAITVACLIAAAFGMGRAQGQTRTQWTATARVMGASRRTVATASLIETAVVAAFGIVAGIGLGFGGAALTLARLRSANPDALLPAKVSMPGVVVLAAIGAGLAISAVLAAVPAFWAARVAPAAALKPVTPVTEATVSRSVSRWWLIGLVGGSGIVDLTLYTVSEREQRSGTWVYIALAFTVLVSLVLGFAALVDGLRSLLPRVGDRIAAIPRPWAVAAGDGLRSHRRLFTYASLSMALIVGVWVQATTQSAFGAIDWGVDWRGSGDPPMVGYAQYLTDTLFNGAVMGAVIGSLAVATLVAVVVTLSSRSALAADAATRAALGLSKSQERIAAAMRQWAPMAMGVVVGGALGWVLPLGIRFTMAVASPNVILRSAHWNLTVVGYSLAAAYVVMVLALAISLAGSLIVGLAARPATPVEALRRTAG